MRIRSLLAAGVALACAGGALARDGDAVGMRALDRLFEGDPSRVLVRGNVGYVAADSGLLILDLTDPAAPARLGHIYLPSAALDVDVDGTFAYVADGESGLYVVDVANPAVPLMVGGLPTSGTHGVAVRSGIAYLAEASDPTQGVYGLRTVSVAQPSNPVPLAFVSLLNGALDVRLDGNTAWLGIGSDVGNPNRGLQAIDVSNPASPAPVTGGFLSTPRAVNAVSLSAGIAYLACGLLSTGDLVVADVSAPGNPTLLARVPLADAASDLAVSGGTAFVADRAAGLLAYDVQSPAAPRAVGALRSARETVSVDLAGSAAVVGERSESGDSALLTADVAVPAQARPLALLTSADATDVEVTRGLAFLLQRDALVIDTTAFPPATVATWRPGGGDFSALAVRELDLVAVCEGRDVRLVDVNDPYAPVERGRATVQDGIAVRPLLVGNTLYVVTGRGVEVFDVSDTAAPSARGGYATPGWSAAMAVEGTTGYLVAADTLYILNLAGGGSPSVLGTLAIPGESLYGVAVRNGHLVLTGLINLLYTVDATTPASARLDAVLAGGPGFDVHQVGSRAIVAAGAAGIAAYDVGDPSNPTPVASYDTSGVAGALALEGTTIFVASGHAQHWLLRCDTCPGTCPEQWAAIAPNSLMAVRQGRGQVFSWTVNAGDDAFNLHQTLVKSALTDLWMDPATVVASGDARSVFNGLDPAPGVAGFFRVFARGSCTGASHPPSVGSALP